MRRFFTRREPALAAMQHQPRAHRWQEECAEISRQKARARRSKDLRRRTLIILAFALPAYLGLSVWWLWRAGEIDQAAQAVELWCYDLSRRAGFELREIRIEGANHLSATLIVETAGIAPGAPLLALDVRDARARLEVLPEIRAATIERRLPDALRIIIEEREPFALWQHEGKQQWIDRDGTILTHPTRAPHTGDFVLTGADAPAHAASLFAMLDVSPLAPEIISAQRIGGRRWDIMLKGGIKIKLPQDNPQVVWARLNELVEEQQLLSRPVMVVDLRLPDRAVLTLRDDTELSHILHPSEDI